MIDASWRGRLESGVDGVTGLLSRCRRFAVASGLADDAQRDLIVSIEELVTNALSHGSRAGRTPDVTVALERRSESIVAVVEDDGPPFDPSSAPEPDPDVPLDQRPVGGLGLLFVRRLMDDVDYERRDGRNRVTLRKDTPKARPPADESS